MQKYFYAASQTHVEAGIAFSVGGTHYPANWFECASPAEIADAGFVVCTVSGQRADERYYDNAEVAEGATLTIASTPKNADVVRALKWLDIQAERNQRTDKGGYLVGGKWFHSDQASRTQQLGLVLLGANIPPGLQWKTMDGSFIVMTPTLAQQILGAAAASDAAIFAAAEAHKAAMEASADPAAYDFSGGWPAVS